MIDAREVLRRIRLPLHDESEVQRIGAEVVALLNSPKFDGRPVSIEVPVGATEEERERSFRIACTVQRRFQAERWAVFLEPFATDAYGQPVSHRLSFAIDAAATRENHNPQTKTNGTAPHSFSLRGLHDELATMFGTASGATVVCVLPDAPELSILLGTYNRLPILQRAVESFRTAVGDLTYEIVVTDGGSIDGSRAWLAAQPDVLLVGERRLEGAVRAFNQAFALCRGLFIANLNDDVVIHGKALVEGVAYLKTHPLCGQVAIPFSGKAQPVLGVNDIYPHREYPAVSWPTTYANFGVTRREVAEAVAQIQGGFWNPIYKTYGADAEFSCWVWKLGHTVDKLPNASVEDVWTEDDLRAKNQASLAVDTKRMRTRWPAEALKPGGPDPRVSDEERVRLHEVRAAVSVMAVPTAAPDLLETVVKMVGFPFPEEERRLRAIAPRLHALDPIEGQFPARAERLLEGERVLYVSLAHARDPQAGLERALRQLGSGGFDEVRWLDYNHEPRQEHILSAARDLKPTICFMQIQMSKDAQGLPPIEIETVRKLRALAPDCVIVTWNGDIAHENSPWTVDWQVEMARAVDLTLHSSLTHVLALRATGAHASAYWNIGIDELQYCPPTHSYRIGKSEMHDVLRPDLTQSMGRDIFESRVKEYDVCFLGNKYDVDSFTATLKHHNAKLRNDTVLALADAFGDRFGLFGKGWDREPEQVVPLTRAHEIYWKSKIGLNVSLMNDLACYSSDRLFRILGCGALLLTKRFPMMSVLGLQHGINCLIWDTPDDAVRFTEAALERDDRNIFNGHNAKDIAAAGTALAHERHTWSARMLELIPCIITIRTTRIK